MKKLFDYVVFLLDEGVAWLTYSIGYLITGAILRQTRKGEKIAVRIGFAIGFVFIGGMGVFFFQLLAARLLCMFLGGVFGAIIAAIFFPKQTKKLEEAFLQRDASTRSDNICESNRSPGKMLGYWDYACNIVKLRPEERTHFFIGIMERAIYRAVTDDDPKEVILPKLNNGDAPGITGESIIWLSSLGGVEIEKPEASEITFLFRERSRNQRIQARFADDDHRDEFIRFLEKKMKKRFLWKEASLPLREATIVPGIFLSLFAAIFLGVAYASTTESPKPIVAELKDFGWENILLVGLIPCAPFALLLIKRVFSPPKVTVLVIDSTNLPK
jgi:hypothetical protein